MSNRKYLYRIRKLKTKPWIKFWLLKEKIKPEEGVLSEILTGTTFTLENSLDRLFNKFDLKGNTSQNTTGKNKLAYTLETLKTLNTGGTWNNNVYTWNGITFTINDDLSIKANGTATSGSPSYLVITNNPNLTSGTEYKLNGCPSGGNVQTYALRMYEGTSYISQTGSDYTFSYSNQNTIRINIFGGATANNLLFKPMIRLSSATDTYEPYTGGIASPNPDYPQVIQNVSGNNNIKIENKNIFDKSMTRNGRWQLTEEVYQNGLKLTSTANSGVCYVNYKLPFDYNETKNLYVSFDKTGTGFVNIYFYDQNNNAVKSEPNHQSSFAVSSIPTTAVNCVIYFYGSTANTGDVTIFDNIQLEFGTSATTYTAHAEQNLPVNLGDIELCKIGTAGDYFIKNEDKWYLHKEIGKTLLNNFNSLTSATVFGTACKFGAQSIAGIKSSSAVSYNFYCDKVSKANGNYEQYKGYCIATNFVVLTDTEDTLENFNSKISGSILYYQLATPTNTEITETSLINELEAILQAKSYNEQTNISQTNEDLPFIIDVQYWMKEGV